MLKQATDDFDAVRNIFIIFRKDLIFILSQLLEKINVFTRYDEPGSNGSEGVVKPKPVAWEERKISPKRARFLTLIEVYSDLI
jgi:hypothetical protein